MNLEVHSRWMRKILPSISLSLALSLSACDRVAEGSFMTASDSAGVRLIDYGKQAVSSSSSMPLGEEVLRIGVEEGPPEYTFQLIGGAVQLNNGNIFVVDARAAELRMFDASGEFRRQVGKRGGGPGEFRMSPQLRALGADSLIVWDGADRLLIYSSDGALIRTANLGSHPRFGSIFLGLDASGGALFRVHGDPREMRARPEGTFRDTTTIVRFGPEGGAAVTQLRLPSDDQNVTRTDGQVMIRPVIFSRALATELAGSGLVTGDGDPAEVQVRDLDGVPIRIIRFDGGATENATSADIEFRRSALTAALQRSTAGRSSSEAYAGVPGRGRIPAFQRILIDPADRVWLKSYPRRGDETQIWLALDAAGMLLGRMQIPFEVEPLSIGERHVIGVTRDEWDVEYLVLHRIPAFPSPRARFSALPSVPRD